MKPIGSFVLTGNYWDEARKHCIVPVDRNTIKLLLHTVFREMQYNASKAKIVIDFTPNKEEPFDHLRGYARTRQCYTDEIISKEQLEYYEGFEPSEEDYRIWIGVPQVFNNCKFLATVEHEVEHLKDPCIEHEFMPSVDDLADLWKGDDRTDSENCDVKPPRR